jgi:hypothetical protein
MMQGEEGPTQEVHIVSAVLPTTCLYAITTVVLLAFPSFLTLALSDTTLSAR